MPDSVTQWARCCLAVLVGVMAESVSAVECELTSPAERAVERMFSQQDVSFEGTVLFERAGNRQFMTVSWPDAEGQGAMRRMNIMVNPPSERWSSPVRSPERICDVLRMYAPSLGAERVVAGRLTQQLSLKPKDPLRLAHRFDLDAETGMALAMATAGTDGQVLERFEYAHIQFGDVATGISYERSDEIYSRGRAVIPGFFLVSEDPVKGVFVVSDGLATASIFVEPLPAGAPAGEGAVIEGATLTYTRGVTGAEGRLLISVLGEIPVVTARMLADAVRSPGVAN